MYVAMDVIVRYFRHRGYRVQYIRNYTDVDHALVEGDARFTRGTRRVGVDPMEMAETYIRSFEEDMTALGALHPNISPRASAHIPEIVVWIQALVDYGYAYVVDGNVYFSVEAFSDYGKLARLNLDDLVQDAPGEGAVEKRHPLDFPLWIAAEGQPRMHWPSPWGDGYPGGHIECSVIADKYLGTPFDIHGGSVEDAFPHNDCEIAQTESLTHESMAKYWLLVGALCVNGAKMSKSLGNFLTIKDALKLYAPEALRYFVLNSHYREPVDFSRDGLQAAQRAVNHLHMTVRRLRRRMQSVQPSAGAGTAALSSVTSLVDYREDFQAAMDDDFNTPQALSVAFELAGEVDRTLEQDQDVSLGTLSAMDKLFRDLVGGVLGMLPGDLERQVGGALVEGLVTYLLELREDFRASHAWEKADAVRNRLGSLGIVVDDGPGDTTWHLKG
jgi:cysteinyl-tRNA synthetase